MGIWVMNSSGRDSDGRSDFCTKRPYMYGHTYLQSFDYQSITLANIDEMYRGLPQTSEQGEWGWSSQADNPLGFW